MTKRVYHCTWTRQIQRICAQGLRPLQTSNWVNGEGKPYRDGAIYVFESEWDAVRWAAKMEWERFQTHGSGKVSILSLDHEGEWETDTADPLNQAAAEAAWLKTFSMIPATAITGIQMLKIEMCKALVTRDNERLKVTA